MITGTTNGQRGKSRAALVIDYPLMLRVARGMVRKWRLSQMLKIYPKDVVMSAIFELDYTEYIFALPINYGTIERYRYF